MFCFPNLDNQEGEEAEDALTAHHLEGVDVVLGDEFLLVDKLTGGDHLDTIMNINKKLYQKRYLKLI